MLQLLLHPGLAVQHYRFGGGALHVIVAQHKLSAQLPQDILHRLFPALSLLGAECGLGKLAHFVEHEVFLVHQAVIAELQHHRTALDRGLHQRDDVLLLVPDRDDLLVLLQALDGAQAVAVARGLLKLQVLGSLGHLLGQHLLDVAGICAAQKAHRLLERLVIFLGADLAAAGRHALLDVKIQARPLLADVLRKIAVAGGQQKDLVDLVHRLLDHISGNVGAEVARPVLERLVAGGDLSVLARANTNIVVSLIVLEQDVVLWGILLDKAALQHQRLKLAGGDDVLEVPDVLHHAVDLGRVLFHAAEVAAHPVFERLGLADIDNLPLFVLHDIDAGLQRQLFDLVAQICKPWVVHPIPSCSDDGKISKKVHRPKAADTPFAGFYTTDNNRSLLSKAGLDQLYQALNRFLFVCAIGDDTDGCAANNAQRKNAQQALGVYSAVFFLNPDRSFELICFLNEECCRTSVKANLVLYHYFFYKHFSYSPILRCVDYFGQSAPNCTSGPNSFFPFCPVPALPETDSRHNLL